METLQHAVLAHTFPLPFVIVMLVAGFCLGYLLPLIAIYLAWKGAWKAPLIILVLPILAVLSQCLQMDDMLETFTTLSDYGVLMLLLGLPLLLCLVGLWLATKNLLKTKSLDPQQRRGVDAED